MNDGVAARMMFACMPVVRSGLTGSGSGAVIAGLRSRVGFEGSWLCAAKTAGARVKANITTICFITSLHKNFGVPTGTY